MQCYGCTNLTSIPDTLVNLTQLFCYECTILTTIPNNKFRDLRCHKCPYLIQCDPDTYKDRMNKYNDAVWIIQQKFWYPYWGKRRQIEEGLKLLI